MGVIFSLDFIIMDQMCDGSGRRQSNAPARPLQNAHRAGYPTRLAVGPSVGGLCVNTRRMISQSSCPSDQRNLPDTSCALNVSLFLSA